MSNMTASERTACASIIHTSAATAEVANAAPIPGLGAAVDTLAMTTMAMRLAAVFGVSIPESVAKAMAIQAIKKTILKQPIKTVAKELSKLVPFLGATCCPNDERSYVGSCGLVSGGRDGRKKNVPRTCEVLTSCVF